MTMDLVLGGTGLKIGTNSSGGAVRKSILQTRHRTHSAPSRPSSWLHASNSQPPLPGTFLINLAVKCAPMPHGFTVACWRASKRRQW